SAPVCLREVRAPFPAVAGERKALPAESTPRVATSVPWRDRQAARKASSSETSAFVEFRAWRGSLARRPEARAVLRPGPGSRRVDGQPEERRELWVPAWVPVFSAARQGRPALALGPAGFWECSVHSRMRGSHEARLRSPE